MEWLNYHHLLYFWAVVKKGSVSGAAKQLRLAQPTITTQVHALEDALGEKLLRRAGRRLAPTDTGRVVYKYADDIFSLGHELLDVLKGRPTGRPMRLVVGVADVLPKIIAYRLLEPALALKEPVQVVCHEDKQERLLSGLSTQDLDVVLADAPMSAASRVRAYSHLLGTCGVSFFATRSLAKRFSRSFPGCLDDAPFLLPMEGSALRLSLDEWFERQRIRPRPVAIFQDRALMTVFGQAGVGAFAAPSAIENEVRRQFHVTVLGRTDAIIERFYAISIERKLKHPAVVAISTAARHNLLT